MKNRASRWAAIFVTLLPAACGSSSNSQPGNSSDAATAESDSGTDAASMDAASMDAGSADVVSTDSPFTQMSADVGAGTSDDSGSSDTGTGTGSNDAADGATDAANGSTPDGNASDSTTGEAGSCTAASTDSDPANCGACGHSCLGGACVAGACQPILLKLDTQPFSVVIDDTRVYWTQGSQASGSISSIGKDGSSFQVLATGQNNAEGLFVDATNAFWVEGGGTPSGIYKANKDGSNRVTLSASIACCRTGIVADANWVYVLQGSSLADLQKVPRTGVPDAGPPTIVSDGWTYARGLSQDENNLYWISAKAQNSQMDAGTPDGGGVADSGAADGAIPAPPAVIVSFPKNGSAATVFTAGGDPQFTAVDANAVYWTDGLSAGAVYRLPFGSAVATLLAHAEEPYGIALDDTYVYFSTLGTDQGDGTIVRVAKDGSDSPKVLLTNLGHPSQVAVDAKALYWGNTYSQTVMKLAK